MRKKKLIIKCESLGINGHGKFRSILAVIMAINIDIAYKQSPDFWQWLWHSWHYCPSSHQRTQVQIQPSLIFIKNIYLLSTVEKTLIKAKEAGDWSIKKDIVFLLHISHTRAYPRQQWGQL